VENLEIPEESKLDASLNSVCVENRKFGKRISSGTRGRSQKGNPQVLVESLQSCFLHF